MVWINIVVYDLTPSMTLDSSYLEVLDDRLGFIFVGSALVAFWDFKLTFFVFSPIYLIGFYFLLSGIIKVTPNDKNSNFYGWMFGKVMMALAVTLGNYIHQLQISKLIISRFLLRTQQEQLNNIFISQPVGVLVYSIKHDAQTKILAN